MLPAAAQSAQEASKAAPTGKAAAYYHFALGHLYGELAGAYGNKGDLLDKAIDNYRLALKEDPDAIFLADELSDLYVQAAVCVRQSRKRKPLSKRIRMTQIRDAFSAASIPGSWVTRGKAVSTMRWSSAPSSSSRN